MAGPGGEPRDEGDGPAPPRALVASLGGGWVAVAADEVDAVVRPAPVTPLGGAPGWVAGLAAVRGRVLPVVDVARLAAAAAAARPDDGWWIVVAAGGRALALAGLQVWRVVDAPAAAAGEVEPAPAVPGLPAGGVVRLDGNTGRGGAALPPAARRLDAAALLDLVLDPDDDPDREHPGG